jgi:hypothetical protein
MLLDVESANSTAYYAGWSAAEDNDELARGGQPGQVVLLGSWKLVGRPWSRDVDVGFVGMSCGGWPL